MKVGDIVEITDGSWSMGIVAGRLEHVFGNTMHGQRYRVMAVSGLFPTDGDDVRPNDMMVVDTNDATRVVFTSESHCRVTKPSPPRPLHTVTIPRGTRCVELVFE